MASNRDLDVKIHTMARNAQGKFFYENGNLSPDLFYFGYIQGVSDLLESIDKCVTIESKEKENKNVKKRNKRKTRSKQKVK